MRADFWDTAGQERFQNLHPSYYHGANACILVFDVERKVTYKNLEKWFSEMRHYCETIPCICVANKIDTNEKVINAKFKFPTKHGLAFEFCSAADGTNVVKLFNDAIRAAWEDKHSEDRGFMGDVLDLLADETLGTGDTSLPTRAAAAKDGEGDVSK
jgi:Rab-like protein 2